MITLEQLQEAGSLAGGYKKAAFTTAVKLENLLKMSEEEQAAFNGTVVIDNCQWAATTHGMPIAKASSVYSCDGTRFGNYKRDLRTFFELELINGKLATIKQFELPKVKKEEKRMANELGLGNDLMELAAALEGGATAAALEGGATTASMESFSDGGTTSTTAPAKASKAALKRQEAERELNEIRSKLGGSELVDRADAIINNVKHGRLLCFITKTDPSLRLSVTKVPILDSDGKYVPTPGTPADVLDKFSKGEKKLPLKYAQTKSALVFKHVKPTGKPVGAVIKTPVGSEVSFTKLDSREVIHADAKNNDMHVRFLDSDSLHPYIAANYSERIKEDDTILGARSTWIALKTSWKEEHDEKTGINTTTVSATLVPEKKEGRKSLLVDGNFVPLKTYQTISQQDLTETNKTTLNLLVEAALRKKGYEDLDDDSKKKVTPTDDGAYTSTWFNNGESIDVNKYDGSGKLTNVQLPVMEKKRTKKGDGWSYTYQYNDMDSEAGPLALPQYLDIIKLTGKSPEEFKEAVKDFGQRHRSATASAKPALTADEYLQAIRSKSVSVTGASSFTLLQQKLEGLA